MRSISVIIATLNSSVILARCLKSIREQNYDQKQIEIICADGGSTDGTREIIQEYSGEVISENTGSPEAAKAIALKYAQNEIVLEVDDDNVLPNREWLAKMVGYFDKEPTAIGVYTWRYTHRRNDKLLNRYFSLFGVNDPVAYFLGRADRQSYHSNQYELAGEAKDKGDHFFVKFTTENLPTVGANGFLIRRKLLLKAQVDEKHFFHIDVNWDLVNQGYRQYVVAKNDIIHASGESFWKFFAKRKRYMEDLYLRDLGNRRYLIYQKDRDRGRIILYSIYTLTVVAPFLEALWGFLRVPDPAWFLHPLICLGIFWIYAVSTINWQVWNFLGQTRKRHPWLGRPIDKILKVIGLPN